MKPIWLALYFVASGIFDRKCERQADEFACEQHKEDGLIEFFEYVEQKEAQQDRDFDDTSQLLDENSCRIAFFDYYCDLLPRYYLAKGGHKINRALQWLYHNTLLGAHPSYEDRIKAAQRYKEQRLA